MAPKRKGKGAVGASSSSAPMVEDIRFQNDAAAQYYEMLLNKSMPRERGFDLEHARRPLIVQFSNQHWADFIKTPSDAVISLVREFYANLRAKPNTYDVLVRGKRVSFSAQTINTLYSMPNYDQEGYRAFMQAPIEYDSLLDFLCYTGATWKLSASGHVMSFPARHLKQAAMAVFLFIIARLMPAKHATDVTKDRAILIYCILMGHTLDVGKLICSSILHAARSNKNINLPHSSLITELCQTAGVQWDTNEEVLKPQVPIKVPTRRIMEEDEAPNARATGSTSQQADEPRHHRSTNQRLDALEHRVENLSLKNSTFMTYVVDFNTALAHRFTDPTMPHPPFPAPPEWRNANNDDDDEGEEDEDDEH